MPVQDAATTAEVAIQNQLEDTVRYAGFLLAPAEGFGWGFLHIGQKKTILEYLSVQW